MRSSVRSRLAPPRKPPIILAWLARGWDFYFATYAACEPLADNLSFCCKTKTPQTHRVVGRPSNSPPPELLKNNVAINREGVNGTPVPAGGTNRQVSLRKNGVKKM